MWYVSTNLSDRTIQRIAFEAQLLLHPLTLLLFVVVILVISLKLEVMDGVSKVVPILVVLQIGDKLVDVHVIGLERASGRQVNVPNDLVDTKTT